MLVPFLKNSYILLQDSDSDQEAFDWVAEKQKKVRNLNP